MLTVPLAGKNAHGRVTLIDDADGGLVLRHSWCVTESTPGCAWPYAVAWIGGRMIRLHKLLTGYDLVDHVNRNTLDNQRHNLRPATHLENQRNRSGWSNARSPYKGVDWRTKQRLWRARIRIGDGRRLDLGSFRSEEAAARAYDAAARKYFGEFAYLNFPDEAA